MVVTNSSPLPSHIVEKTPTEPHRKLITTPIQYTSPMAATAHKQPTNCDVLIIGAGVMGLAIGIALLEAEKSLR